MIIFVGFFWKMLFVVWLIVYVFVVWELEGLIIIGLIILKIFL